MSPAPSDAEVICSFMQPITDSLSVDEVRWWNARWLMSGNWDFSPRALDLDALWSVEQKLMDIGYEPRIVGLYRRDYRNGPPLTFSWHLTAAQKVAALASVIMGIK